jgi:hypothetical protein
MRVSEHSGAWSCSANFLAGIGKDVGYPLDRVVATADIAVKAVCVMRVEGCMFVKNMQLNSGVRPRCNTMEQEIEGAAHASTAKGEHLG